MKKMLAVLFAAGASAAFAAPGIDGVSLSVEGDPATFVKITYTLTDEPAVVTIDIEALEGANWKSVGYERLDMFSGEANRVVRTVGTPVDAYWFPPRDTKRAYSAGNLRAVVKAWPLSSPPDYMAIDLANVSSNVVNFYTSTNALPGGFSNRAYRTSHLLMRKIPAAGVVWLMGSPANEAYRTGADSNSGAMETLHKVMLTEDYYAGVFEVTQKQYYNIAGTLNQCTFTDYYDSDVLPFQAADMSQIRGGVKKNFSTYWPENGHNVTARSVIGCLRAKCGIADIDLPTSAQWEYAARAGTEKNLPDWGAHDNNFTASEYRFWRIDTVAWWTHNSKGEYRKKDGTVETRAFPHPVGTLAPNPWGLYDTSGNVWEACLDHGWDVSADQVKAFQATFTPGWEPDANGSFVGSSVTTNPVGFAKGIDSAGQVVYRGGYFSGDEKFVRNAAVSPQGFDYKFGAYKDFKGFRLFCSAKEAVR